MGGVLVILSELGGDDERRQNNQLGIDRVNVQLVGELAVDEWRGWQRMSLGPRRNVAREEWAGQAPGAGEASVEAVQNADGERHGFERQVGSGEHGLHQRNRSVGQRGSGRD